MDIRSLSTYTKVSSEIEVWSFGHKNNSKRVNKKENDLFFDWLIIITWPKR
jgi:hypothetical protein